MPRSYTGTAGKAALVCFAVCITASADFPARQYAEVRVLDAQSGRSVPLVELETVHHVRFVTDNSGRVAIGEPDLLDREVFFTVRSHGYEIPPDGFGYRGVRLQLRAGQKTELRIQRRQIAERLCRLTGEGLYRDSLLLGYRVPGLGDHPGAGEGFPRRARGLVAGQDSVQAAIYRGRIYWFWSDTNRLAYPLGLFRTAGARTPVFPVTFDPADGIPYQYFTDEGGFVRPMIPLPERKEGVVWIDGVCVVPDQRGHERLVCHYSRRKGLAEELEHGVAVFDDKQEIFVPVRTLPLSERWRHPSGHATPWEEQGKRYILFGNPAPVVRVPARYEAVLDPLSMKPSVARTPSATENRSLRYAMSREEWSGGGRNNSHPWMPQPNGIGYRPKNFRQTRHASAP